MAILEAHGNTCQWMRKCEVDPMSHATQIYQEATHEIKVHVESSELLHPLCITRPMASVYTQ